ncbi:MAG: PAS domain S-box protein [Anaerolineae bacterium]|nr:PAS domain S-box protein [Anaerolineae bacterium]
MEPEHVSESAADVCSTSLFREDAISMVLDAAPIGIVAVDNTGCIVLANRSAQGLFGYTEEELVGQPLTLLIPEESRQIHLQQHANYMRNPHVRPMGNGLNLSARRKDGSVFPVEISLGFTETPQGLLSIAFVADVTRQREAEQLRDTMIHTLVHDLRNPLSTIRTGLQVLEMETAKLDSDQQTIVEIALNNSERMFGFINAILEVNQLESGTVVLRPTTFRIQDHITELLTALAPLAEKKAQRLLNDAAADLPPVYADATIIARVLENLIGNAIKYTPENGVVRVSAQRKTDDPTRLRVDVSDTGPGIAPELLPRLFGKFVAGKSKERGHGLGLAFCKLAIEAHGENISVQNTGTTGTTFSFTLPLAEVAA